MLDLILVLGIFAFCGFVLYKVKTDADKRIRGMNNEVEFDDWKGSEFRETETDPQAVPLKLE